MVWYGVVWYGNLTVGGMKAARACVDTYGHNGYGQIKVTGRKTNIYKLSHDKPTNIASIFVSWSNRTVYQMQSHCVFTGKTLFCTH